MNAAERQKDAAEHLAGVKRAIDARLELHLGHAKARASAAGAHATAIVSAISSLVGRGGKRLRPALTIAAHAACGGDAAESALLDVGCAWELLQAYFLIHDDWMDDDATRRGGPSVHVALAQHHGDAKLGASSAILAGDLACALAHEVLASASAPAEVVHEATAAFARVHEQVVLGQSIDLTLDARDEGAVERMHELKTGSYTVLGPLELGAIFARAGAEARTALERFGRPMGVAFQLRDDLLGTFGDTKETGKPVGNDVRAGKRTALVSEARKRASDSDRARLDAAFAKPPLSDADVAWVVALFESAGAIDAVEKRIASLCEEANEALGSDSLSRDGAELLAAIGSLLVRRRS